MTDKFEVTVSKNDCELWSGICRTPLEIGRQQDGDPSAMELQDLVTSQRLVMAPLSERSIPRRALRVDFCQTEGFTITNIHSRLTFYVGSEHWPLAPGEVFESEEETVILLPEKCKVRMTKREVPSGDASAENDTEFRTMSSMASPTVHDAPAVRFNELFAGSTEEDRGRVAVDLVQSAVTVMQQAAGSDKFFDSTVHAVATMIDLDRALVLLRERNQWIVRSAFSVTYQDAGTRKQAHKFSRALTNRVLRAGKTVIYDPSVQLTSSNSSMESLDRAVAAPIFDENQNVIGAIYGDRRSGGANGGTAIGDLEAALLEIFAGAVSSGIARQRQESIRSNLTQFFSQEVAARLEDDEDLLAGRDAEVSVMFCDIRQFSTIAERVGAKQTIEWINDVLTELSQCVTNTNGVLVDYIGDELMAMWGAPAEQHDHALRACESAVQMLRRIGPLREKWDEIIPDHFGIGIGINTGIARVGNTGSQIKFKYGPLGNMVNLASRVQGITKKFGVPVLITDSTVAAIDGAFENRRLATVKPFGFSDTVTIHELQTDATRAWPDIARRYEVALECFGNGDLSEAAKLLAALVHDHPNDNPSVVLLGRVVEALTHRGRKLDTVWVMDSK